MSMKRDQRGFTLMELMIVIVIIGVLAAIGVPAYNSYVDKAKAATCQANRRTLDTAVGLYYAEHGEYPTVDTGGTGSTLQSALEEYLDNANEMTCPKDGTYTLNKTSHKVVCSIHNPTGTEE